MDGSRPTLALRSLSSGNVAKHNKVASLTFQVHTTKSRANPVEEG